jgi:hypothetical protein
MVVHLSSAWDEQPSRGTNVTGQLKDKIVKSEEAAVARQWLGNHVSAGTNTHTSELLEAVISMWSVLRLHNMDKDDRAVTPHVEASSSTSTIVLRVTGGDEKGTQGLKV